MFELGIGQCVGAHRVRYVVKSRPQIVNRVPDRTVFIVASSEQSSRSPACTE
jgi:hypothetical protein